MAKYDISCEGHGGQSWMTTTIAPNTHTDSIATIFAPDVHNIVIRA